MIWNFISLALFEKLFLLLSLPLLCSPSLFISLWVIPTEAQCHNDGPELLTHCDTRDTIAEQVSSLVQSLAARLFSALFRPLDQSLL